MDKFNVYMPVSYLKRRDASLVEPQRGPSLLVSTESMLAWFADISNYLAIGELPQHLSSKEKQRIIQLSSTYSWMGGDLYKTSPDLIIRRCVREDEMHDILKANHDGPCGGHFSNKRTAYKILHSGYYWPTLFRDAKRYV